MSEPLLEVRDVHTYYGDSHVLHGVSLTVDEGEIVALLGRNGAGKTTTIRSIMGLTQPRRGTVTLKGTDVTGYEPYRIARAGIGLVPEERRVFPDLTVRDNLEVVRAADSSWTLERIYDVFPALNELEDSLGKHLSGGEQQMLTIARALVRDPDLLLLDEPTEGLAPTIVEDIEDLLEEIIETGITVLLTEQNTRFALDHSDRAYIVDRGEIAWDGSVEELRESEDVIGRYLSLAKVGEE